MFSTKVDYIITSIIDLGSVFTSKYIQINLCLYLILCWIFLLYTAFLIVIKIPVIIKMSAVFVFLFLSSHINLYQHLFFINPNSVVSFGSICVTLFLRSSGQTNIKIHVTTFLYRVYLYITGINNYPVYI